MVIRIWTTNPSASAVGVQEKEKIKVKRKPKKSKAINKNGRNNGGGREYRKEGIRRGAGQAQKEHGRALRRPPRPGHTRTCRTGWSWLKKFHGARGGGGRRRRGGGRRGVGGVLEGVTGKGIRRWGTREANLNCRTEAQTHAV